MAKSTTEADKRGQPQAAAGRSVGPLGELMTVRLRRVDVLLSRAFATVTSGRGLRSGMISSLALIVANPGISQNEISQFSGVDKSAIVGIVNRFEELGWVVRKRSEADKRRHELTATPAGEAELAEIVRMIREVEARLLAEVSSEDLDEVSVLLGRMYDSCLNASRSDEA